MVNILNKKKKSRRVSMKQKMQCFILSNEDVYILCRLAEYGAYKMFPNKSRYELPKVLQLLFTQLDFDLGKVSDYKEIN